MNGTYNMHGGNEKCVPNFCHKTREQTTSRPKSILYNMKMDIREIVGGLDKTD
jgi:hypothetical protein